MLDKTKTDGILGKKVNKYLLEKGVETPLINNWHFSTDEYKIEQISKSFENIMHELGLDLGDDSLIGTPDRVGKMFVNELFWGLDYENFPKITTVENKMNYDEMIIEKNIKSYSACEHHFVIIDGFAHIAYIPNKVVLGLSKMNRIVEYFSRRPQIQERLVEQIYYAMEYILGTEDIAVMIDAEHYCVKSRGVNDTNSNTITSKLGGIFKKQEVRNEFLSLIKI